MESQREPLEYTLIYLYVILHLDITLAAGTQAFQKRSQDKRLQWLLSFLMKWSNGINLVSDISYKSSYEK